MSITTTENKENSPNEPSKKPGPVDPNAHAPISMAELKELGNIIFEQTRNALLIGRSNVEEDYEKTSGFSYEALAMVRKKFEWKQHITEEKKENITKDEKEKVKVSWKPLLFNANTTTNINVNADENEDALIEMADRGARAFFNKAGNCYEHVSVAIMLLYKTIMTNPKFEDALKKGAITISSLELRNPLDHMTLRMDIATKDISGKDITLSIYIDPWLKACYSAEDFDKYKEELLKVLLKEKTSMYNKLLPTDKAEELNYYLKQNFMAIGPHLTSRSFTPYTELGSALEFELYQKVFNSRYLQEAQNQEAFAALKEKLLNAIRSNDIKPIGILLQQGVPIDSEILKAAQAGKNQKITSKLLHSILENSSYCLGSKDSVNFKYIEPNTMLFLKDKDDIIMVYKDKNNKIHEEKVHYSIDNINIGKNTIPLNKPENINLILENHAEELDCNLLSPVAALQKLKHYEKMFLLKEAALKTGQGLLSYALEHDPYLFMEFLQNENAQTMMGINVKQELQGTNDQGKNLLLLAVEQDKHSIIIKTLLQMGADPMQKDNNGNTALAESNQNPRISKLINEHIQEKTQSSDQASSGKTMLTSWQSKVHDEKSKAESPKSESKEPPPSSSSPWEY